MEDPLTQKSVVYLAEVETLAQEILELKRKKLELSNARNKFNEAYRAIEANEDRRVSIEVGCSFIEFPNKPALGLIKENIEKATGEIDSLHEDLKLKASQLRDLEHEPRIEGMLLKPLSFAEARSLNKAFGNS